MDPSPKELKIILEDAIAAPSARNLQPFRFEMENGELHVVDTHRFDFSLNTDNHAILLSIGCAIENIVLSASQFGFRCEPRYYPESANEYFAASLRWAKDNALKADGLCLQIPRRRTNRFAYEKTPVENEKLEKLRSFLSVQPNIKFDFIGDPSRKNRMSRLLIQAERICWKNETTRKEFLKELRAPAYDRKSKIEALGIEPFQKKALHAVTYAPWIGKWLDADFFSFLSAKKIIAETNHLGLICLENTRPSDYLHAGRIIQNLWLRLTEMDVAMQPVCNLIGLIMLYKLKVQSFLTYRDNCLLKEIAEEFNHLFGLGFGKTSIFLFRMGRRTKEPIPRSRRKPLAAFLGDSCKVRFGHD